MLTPFSDFKTTEMSPEQIDELFVIPKFIDLIYTPNSTFIEGQRGSGKTMLMRYITNNPKCVGNKIKYMGVYLRFDRQIYGVAPLCGKDTLDLFSHYITINLFYLLVQRLNSIYKGISFQYFNEFASLICCTFYEDSQACNSYADLLDFLERQRLLTMKFVRNPKRIEPPLICEYSSCFDRVISVLHKEEMLQDVTILFLFDEFEILNRDQQSVINGMIKAAEYGYTFKVFHRPFGREVSQVLDSSEYVKDRDDYTVLNLYEDVIGGERHFPDFIKELVEKRLEYYYKFNHIVYQEEDLDIGKYLSTLSIDEEFAELGKKANYIKIVKERIRKRLSEEENKQLIEFIETMSSDVFRLRLFQSIVEKTKRTSLTPIEIAERFMNESEQYKNWVQNYKLAVLYLACHENQVQKQTSGLTQILHISCGTARYVINILHYIFITGNEDNIYPTFSPAVQTAAAYKVSNIAFNDIVSIPNVGYQMMSMITYLGKVFRLYHRDSALKNWETNHFSIRASTNELSEEQSKELKSILLAAITWGFLTTKETTKAKNQDEFVENFSDYLLHPIFTVFFCISWRKKQKCYMTDRELYEFACGTLNEKNATYHKRFTQIYGKTKSNESDWIQDDLFKGDY